MSTKTASVGSTVVSPVATSRTTTWSSRAPPPPPTTSPRQRTSTPGAARVSMRYCDMLAASVGPRTSRRDVARVPGEVQGGLARGVAAADDVRPPPEQPLRVERGGAVVDARRLVAARGRHASSRRYETPVARTTDRACTRRPPLDSHDQPLAVVASSDVAARDVRERAAEDPGLLVGALGELGPGDAAGEAEVVADQRARPRLPADRLALDHEGPQPLGCRVHRGSETGRARADDHDVEHRVVVSTSTASP